MLIVLFDWEYNIVMNPCVQCSCNGDASNIKRKDRMSENSEPVSLGDNVYCTSASDNITAATGGENSINAFSAEAEMITSSEIDCFPQHVGNTSLVHEKMRRKLKYFFMNPIQKWRKKGRFPWKLCLQIIKIVFVTIQLTLFGVHSYRYVQQHQDMTTALRHIFLSDWTGNLVTYPPSTGPYAVYTVPEFYYSVNNVIKQFRMISTLALGSYGYDSKNNSMTSVQICVKYYKGGSLFPFNSTLALKNSESETCHLIPPLYPPDDPSWNNYTIKHFLNESKFSIDFTRLILAKLSFSLKVVLMKFLNKLSIPDCYRLNVSVLYDNSDHDGQISVSLFTHSKKLNCCRKITYKDDTENLNYILHQILNGVVIAFCVLSLILCLRSLYRGQVLKQEVVTFFQTHFAKELTLCEQLDFIDFWYVMIIINDLLIISGSIIKIKIEEPCFEGDYYSKCSILLGIGNLLVWVGLLRYLGFFPKYNMLILTLKQALPNVMRFMLCALFLYAGFCFCGWVVLGPYHIKFQSISSTSECLFSIMNGDDMYATFAMMDTDSTLIWWFSRIYLYSFISLFIYVVISLFISVIMDTFETIKHIYIHGSPPKTTIDIFLMVQALSSESEEQSDYQQQNKESVFKRWCLWVSQCCRRWNHKFERF